MVVARGIGLHIPCGVCGIYIQIASKDNDIWDNALTHRMQFRMQVILSDQMSTQGTFTHSESEHCGESHTVSAAETMTRTMLCQWPTFYKNKYFWRKWPKQ